MKAYNIKTGNHTIKYEERIDGYYIIVEDVEYKLNNIEGD